MRLLSRNYTDYLSRVSFERVTGGCVEATPEGEICAQLRTLFLEFLLEHTKDVEVTFQKLADGTRQVVYGQVGYATLLPEQYQTIVRGAPDFEGTAEGEAIKYADGITWDFSGKEPIPTKAKLRLLDEQKLRNEASIYWFRKIPVQGGSHAFVWDLDYFPSQIAERKISPLTAYKEAQTHKVACLEGANIVRLRSGNAWARHGRIADNLRSIRHHDRSSKCRINFSGGWTANDGHFFLVQQGVKPVTVVERWANRSWNFVRRPAPHPRDVPLGDGSAQMLEAVSYSGRATRGRRVGGLDCGAEIRFELRQYPLNCAPLLVEGYTEVHGVAGTSSVE